MHNRRIMAFVLAALTTPSTGLAGTIVLPAMLNDGSADPKKVDGVRQLVSAELEFASGVDGVKEVSSSDLTDACFSDPRCMAGIAKSGGGDQVLAGKVSQAGPNLTIDFVFYDGGTIARRKQFQVPSDSAAMSNAMTPIVSEMISGRNPDADAAAATSADDFSDLPEEDDGMMVALAPIPIPQPAYQPPPQPAYQPPPQPAPVYQPPAPAPMTDADAASMISFGNSAAEISVEEVDQMIQFGTPTQASTYQPPPQQIYQPPPQPAYQPPPQPVYQPAPQPAYQPQQPVYQDPALAREEAESRRPAPIENLDDDPSTRRSGGSSGSKGKVERDVANTMQISFRGGYSKYFVFDFATVGAELAVPVYQGFHLMAGVEGYAVNRILPPELQLATGIYSEWNTIFPANVGAMYKFTPRGSIAQPYIGGDIIFVQYYKDEIGADWAGGARLRAGLDVMIVKNFGLNINLGVGGWTGKNWSLIESGLQQSGLLPQASAGTVIAF